MAPAKELSQDLCVFFNGVGKCCSFPAELSLFSNCSNYVFFTFSLSYLQADYNVIKRIDSGALRFLYKLRVLILNDNLIPVLPAHLFRLESDYCTAKLLYYARPDLQKYQCQTQLASMYCC